MSNKNKLEQKKGDYSLTNKQNGRRVMIPIITHIIIIIPHHITQSFRSLKIFVAYNSIVIFTSQFQIY